MKQRLTFIIFILLFGINSNACSCGEKPSVKEAFDSASVIFSGKVYKTELFFLVDTTVIDTGKNIYPLSNVDRDLVRKFAGRILRKTDFIVSQYFKGEVSVDTFTVLTGRGGGDCGIKFVTDQEYIIYGSDKSYFSNTWEGRIVIPKFLNSTWTHLCTRTEEFKESEKKALLNMR